MSPVSIDVELEKPSGEDPATLPTSSLSKHPQVSMSSNADPRRVDAKSSADHNRAARLLACAMHRTAVPFSFLLTRSGQRFLFYAFVISFAGARQNWWESLVDA
ncbi:uncharacterized protein PHALS_10783 [Plasmopara halstedii]|uniref:Uncharacterized protein n=1 Tax=Plasmopara halstedii TaxID=4781 RepID=A0A0P1AHG1_PLAHL|nr:uncharacterized protein PHALS_10783 [Plasmopara halstedii]CEG40596.1 hypothetical protein PHALS_10783 [Plasmopara halstedii]|eukprot:XP_024576965.1 hypothetical protein PHALS_10783 [Plasmopara halstedii]